MAISVPDLMKDRSQDFDEVMLEVCRTNPVDSTVLYSFAAAVAQQNLPLIETAYPGNPEFKEAVEACLEGETTAKAVAGVRVQRAMVRLFQDGTVFETAMACKAVRACVLLDPSRAALGAGYHSLRGSGGGSEAQNSLRLLFRTIFLESQEETP